MPDTNQLSTLTADIGGPTKVAPAFSTASAKWAFSDRKPARWGGSATEQRHEGHASAPAPVNEALAHAKPDAGHMSGTLTISWVHTVSP